MNPYLQGIPPVREERRPSWTAGVGAMPPPVSPKVESDDEASGEQDEEQQQFASRLRSALISIDSDASGELSVAEFRNLYKAVFPGQVFDDRLLERMFSEIDKDDSGSVEPGELLSYLNFSAKEIRTARRRRPRTLRRWIWYTIGAEDVDWEAGGAMEESEIRGAMLINVYRVISHITILTSIATMMTESLPAYQNMDVNESDHVGPPGTSTTAAIEATCIIFFTAEFMAYLLSFPYGCVSGEKRLNILLQADTWIHVLSTIPWYIEMMTPHGVSGLVAFRVTRLLRILRVVRSLKMAQGRFSRIPALGDALKSSITSLLMLFNLILITCALSGSFIFLAETREAHFDFEKRVWLRKADSSYLDAGERLMFQSIPDSLWWAIVTITTVGYGDKWPVTEVGKGIACMTMLWSICMMAYPITILSSVFQTLADEERDKASIRDFCQKFYEGIKKWLDSREGEVGELGQSVRSPLLPAEAFPGFGGEDSVRLAGSMGGIDAATITTALQPILSVLEDIQARLDRLEVNQVGEQVCSSETWEGPAASRDPPREDPPPPPTPPPSAQP
eukprot:Hpha_TRINITY_DN10267_c0_g2::TRINITY_DN10267_c0_g2_i1::g.35175::m.35175